MLVTYNTYRLNRLYELFKEIDVTTLVVSGNPRPGSRTLKLAVAVGEALSETPVTVIDAGEIGAGLLTPGDEATAAAVEALLEASLLVVATPTYKGSYTGVLKVLLDNLQANALAGKTAVPVLTAGVQPQADAAAGHLTALLTELGATLGPTVTATEAELGDIPAIAARAAAAAASPGA
ncbi:NAD(P)H-dependent oxidoreductase [Actinoplanes sp. NPDC089786]|uniref:NADPH-dependent FMN reductase n=1 Tax=Actinoplanes sp. NPDC089786 TaxID=3155185 RepID=UPI00342E3898